MDAMAPNRPQRRFKFKSKLTRVKRARHMLARCYILTPTTESGTPLPLCHHLKSLLPRTLPMAVLLLSLVGSGFVLWGFWIPMKAQLAQYLLERAWQTSRETGQPQKAWSWADSWPVAKLSIKALNLQAIVLKEAGGEALAFGPVLLEQSASLGGNGTSVIAAHRDTHFKALSRLEQGALIKVEPMAGPSMTYQVNEMRIVRWDQSGLIKDTQSSQLIITSCWPFDSLIEGPLRFIAIADRVAPQ